jgi:poly-beta-1,6-N-acetyl-D-glucosamine synthase
LTPLAWLGAATAFFTALYAVALDKSWRDLKYLYVLPLWLPYSLLMNAVMVRACFLELRGDVSQWHKLERTGVVSR